MRIVLIVISFVLFSALVEASRSPSTESLLGVKHSNSSVSTPILVFESRTLPEVSTERVSDEKTYVIGQSPAQEEILDIPTDRDSGKKKDTSFGQQPANDKVIDISTERDGGKKKDTSFGQQPANDKVLDIPTERDGGKKKDTSVGQQPANDKVLDISTERDSGKQKQKKTEEPVEKVKADDEVTPVEVTPVEVTPVEVTPVEGRH